VVKDADVEYSDREWEDVKAVVEVLEKRMVVVERVAVKHQR
jgi:hypothetical protein